MVNREIKFRAWVEGTWIETKEGEKMIYNFLESIYSEIYSLQDKNIKVMQYTGLKDKNGKEIYEGDILLREKEIHEVMYVDGCFCTRNHYLMGHIEPINWGNNCNEIINFNDSIKFKIIGNIHETPELLNK